MTRSRILAAVAVLASASPAVAQHHGGGGHAGGGHVSGGHAGGSAYHGGGYGGGYRGYPGGGYGGYRGGSFSSFSLGIGLGGYPYGGGFGGFGGYPYGGFGGYGGGYGGYRGGYGGYGSGFGIGLSVPLYGGGYGSGGYGGGYGGYAGPVVSAPAVAPVVVTSYPTVVTSAAPVILDGIPAAPVAQGGQVFPPAQVPSVPAPTGPTPFGPAPFGPTGETGLRITDIGTGTAFAAGLRKGDIIVSVDGRRTSTFADIRGVIAAAGGPVTVEYIDGATGEVNKKAVPVDAGKVGVIVVEAPVPRT